MSVCLFILRHTLVMTMVHACLLKFSMICLAVTMVNTCPLMYSVVFWVVAMVHACLFMFFVIFSSCDNGSCLSVNVLCDIF